MRISTSLLYQRGVNAINDQQSNLSATQTQLATGERLKEPADDPFASTRIIAIDEQTSSLDQFTRNADFARTRLELEETAITSSINMLQRVRELAIQALNGTFSAEDRLAISYEVGELANGILQVANSTDGSGEYIFAGNQTSRAAYVDNNDGTYSFQGDQGQRFVQIGTNREVATGDSGFDVFGNLGASTSTNDNVMEVVRQFEIGLQNDAIDPDSLGDIDLAIENLSRYRSGVGARINTIESEKGAIESINLSLSKNRSELADLDYAEAISRFQQQLAGLQAAQQSFVQIQNLSLFNYI